MANKMDYEYVTVVFDTYTLEEIGKAAHLLTINDIIKQLMDIYMLSRKYMNIRVLYEDNLIKLLGDRLETDKEKFIREKL